MTIGMISLKGRTAISRGGRRAIYEHPDDPARLIKIVHRELMARPRKPFRPGGEKHMQREYIETERLRRLGALPPWLAAVEALVETDIGPGIVVPAIRERDGRLAPMLMELAGRLHEPAYSRALQAFASAALESRLIIIDLSPANVVARTLPDGEVSLHLVDGYGSPTLLPIRAWSPRLNRLKNRKRIRDMIRKLQGMNPAIAMPAAIRKQD